MTNSRMKALRNKYLPAFLTAALLVLAQFADSQVYQGYPQYGSKWKRVTADSAFSIPTGCGTPLSIKSQDIEKRLFQYYDSCNKKFWVYDPKLLAWDTIHIGASSSGSADTASLSNRINQKVNISDTSGMLTNYVRTNRSIVDGHGILGGGNLSANRTLRVDTATLFPEIRATIPPGGGSGFAGLAKEGLVKRNDTLILDNKNEKIYISQPTSGSALATGWSATGPPTYDVSSGQWIFHNNAENRTAYIANNSAVVSEDCYIEAVIVIDSLRSTSIGPSIGFRSINPFTSGAYTHDVELRLVTGSAATNSGKLTIYGKTGNATIVSDSGRTANGGDTVVMRFDRDKLSYTGRAENLTQDWKLQVKVTTTPAGSPFNVHNRSKVAFNPGGGGYRVISFKYVLKVPIQPEDAFCGNSITQRQGADSVGQGYVSLVGSPENNMVFGGGADGISETYASVGEMMAAKPKRMFMMIGGNDILFDGSWTTTSKNEYIATRDSLVRAGIEVIHLLPTPRTATDVSALKNWLDTLTAFRSDRKIDTWTPLLGSGTSLATKYDKDGTHPNSAGHAMIASTINASMGYQNGRALYAAKDIIATNGRVIGTTQTTTTDVNDNGGLAAYAQGSTTKHTDIGHDGSQGYLDPRTNNSTYDNLRVFRWGSTQKMGIGIDPLYKLHILESGSGSQTGLRLEKAAGSISAEGQESRFDFGYGTSTLGRIALALGSGSNWDMMLYTTNSTSVNSTPFLSALGTNKVGFNKARPIHGVDITGSLAASDSALFDGQIYNRNSTYREAAELKMVVIDTVTKRLYHQTIGTGGGSGTVTSVGSGYGLTGGPITNSGTLVADTTVGTGLISWYRWAKLRDSLGSVFGGGAFIQNQYGSAQSARFWIGGSGRSDSAFIGRTVDVPGNFKAGGLRAYASGSGVASYIDIGYDGTGNYGWIKAVTESSADRALVLAPTGNAKVGIANVTAPTAYLHLPVNTTSIAPLRLANSGNTLSSFNDGDIWNNGNTLRFRANSATRRLLMSNDAAPSNGQIPIGNGTDYTVANITSTGGTITVTNGSGTIDLSIPTTTHTAGTWTPTITGGANYASSSNVTGKYTRTNNIVTATISGTVTATAGGSAVIFDASLPIASAMTGQQDLHGNGVASFAGSNEIIFVLANDTDDRATLSMSTVGSTSARTFVVTFQYEVK